MWFEPNAMNASISSFSDLERHSDKAVLVNVIYDFTLADNVFEHAVSFVAIGNRRDIRKIRHPYDTHSTSELYQPASLIKWSSRHFFQEPNSY